MGIVAHDLKVPMTSISGYTDLALMMGELSDRQKEFLQRVKDTVKRMAILVSDLADISRIESGHFYMNDTRVPVADIVQAVRDGSMTQMQEYHHEYIEDIRPNLPDMQVDAENCCSISIGEGQEAVVLTVELRSEGEILIFTPLERYPGGISPELASRIETINTAQQDDSHYLTTSEHSVFFCASHSIEEATITLFADWILDFYKLALVWRERYRRDTAPGTDSEGNDPKAKRGDDPGGSASLRISPSTGLKV